MKHTPLLALLSSVASTFANKCECGFSVNNTNAQSFGLFTELEETDFFHTASVDATFRIGTTGWDAQVYNTTAEQIGRLIGFSKQLGNVITNPLPEGKWGGPPKASEMPVCSYGFAMLSRTTLSLSLALTMRTIPETRRR